jgi:AraC-like DNA-binding protein
VATRSRPASELLTALRRARDVADRDFAEPLTLAEMARAANLSKFHFARMFAATYGETPRSYLTRRRIERAKDLLRAANLTVTEICLLVGFESLGSFSTRFRELVGCSPSAYRQAAVSSGGIPAIPGCFVLMWTRPSQLSNREEAGVGAAG